MTGYKIVNLQLMLEECGEERAKLLLSDFSCPQNKDVETFLHKRAIPFSKQGWAQTHLIYASYKGRAEIAGYFALASKYISVRSDMLTQRIKKRLNQFATYDPGLKTYALSAPLIAQLGKNYTNGFSALISGDELLKLACEKVSKIQMDLGGRFAYLECEDNTRLIEFYTLNGFCEFDRRTLDKDETDISGDHLVQLLKYIK